MVFLTMFILCDVGKSPVSAICSLVYSEKNIIIMSTKNH